MTFGSQLALGIPKLEEKQGGRGPHSEKPVTVRVYGTGLLTPAWDMYEGPSQLQNALWCWLQPSLAPSLPPSPACHSCGPQALPLRHAQHAHRLRVRSPVACNDSAGTKSAIMEPWCSMDVRSQLFGPLPPKGAFRRSRLHFWKPWELSGSSSSSPAYTCSPPSQAWRQGGGLRGPLDNSPLSWSHG